MQKQVYAIGSEAVPVLIEHGYAPQDFAERRLRHHELTEIRIRHSLFVADIHTRVMLLTRNGLIALAHWQEGSRLWDSVVPRRVDPAIPIRPDAYFILKQADRPEGKNKFHVFLEADRSTMSHGRMATKIVGYLAYYEQDGYRQKYPGMRAFIVATVTQTRERAEQLRKDLHPLIPHAASRGCIPIHSVQRSYACDTPAKGRGECRLTCAVYCRQQVLVFCLKCFPSYCKHL